MKTPLLAGQRNGGALYLSKKVKCLSMGSFMSTIAGHSKCTPSKIKGFTLFELLVVIGIIAVLAILLLSAVRSSMEKGNIISCINKQRQLAIANASYCSDNQGEFPSGSSFPYWFVALAPYLQDVKTAFSCPSWKTPKVWTIDGVEYPVSIGMNTWLLLRPDVGPEGTPHRLPIVPFPSKTMLFSDCQNDNQDGEQWVMFRNFSAWNKLSPRHGGKWVSTFVDGHAEMLDDVLEWNQGATPEDRRKNQLFWTGTEPN